jgi:hypothetical protein
MEYEVRPAGPLRLIRHERCTPGLLRAILLSVGVQRKDAATEAADFYDLGSYST